MDTETLAPSHIHELNAATDSSGVNSSSHMSSI